MTKRPEEIALLAESGRLLAQVFSHLDRQDLIGMSTMQINDMVDGLTSLLEPIVMVVLGVLVGGMVVAMYLPIFKLGSVIH